MQELICSTLSEFSLHLEAGMPSLALKSCMRAMKLFLQPKNMMGKAKKTDRRNPMLTMKQMTGLLLGSYLMFSRKFANTSGSSSIDHTKWYPRIPISRYEAEQTRMPVSVAFENLLSFTLRMPLKMGKRFIWNPKARIKLGMEEMAPNQSSGKVFMALASGMSFSLEMMAQWMTKVPMKTRIPATPMKAMNLSLSIFLTRMEGISRSPMARAMKVRLVYHSFSTSCGSTFLKISLMLSLKMMISRMQTPMLFRKIRIDPSPLQNLLWYT